MRNFQWVIINRSRIYQLKMSYREFLKGQVCNSCVAHFFIFLRKSVSYTSLSSVGAKSHSESTLMSFQTPMAEHKTYFEDFGCSFPCRYNEQGLELSKRKKRKKKKKPLEIIKVDFFFQDPLLKIVDIFMCIQHDAYSKNKILYIWSGIKNISLSF